jgi:hypothetical protein
MLWKETEEVRRSGGAIAANALSYRASIIVDWALSKGLDGGPST